MEKVNVNSAYKNRFFKISVRGNNRGIGLSLRKCRIFCSFLKIYLYRGGLRLLGLFHRIWGDLDLDRDLVLLFFLCCFTFLTLFLTFMIFVFFFVGFLSLSSSSNSLRNSVNSSISSVQSTFKTSSASETWLFKVLPAASSFFGSFFSASSPSDSVAVTSCSSSISSYSDSDSELELPRSNLEFSKVKWEFQKSLKAKKGHSYFDFALSLLASFSLLPREQCWADFDELDAIEL